jgi:hypothetical protein
MVTILLGVISSTLAEIITALNKKLQNTVLKGDAAFLIVFGVSLVGAIGKEILAPGFAWVDLRNLQLLSSTFAEIFSVSQVYFIFVVEKLNLDVQPIPPVAIQQPSTTVAQDPNAAV